MLQKDKVYYLPREGKRVAFVGYDEIGLARVVDGDGNEYLCHETHLQNVTVDKDMTIDEILQREG